LDKEKLVSVIIPTYNSERYIKKCIDSILEQSYKNYEIIIIDNHSTDETVNIIKSYKTNKIKSFSIKNKGQISLSRNLGIKNSNGNWIAFLDSDDAWYKDKLSLIMNNFTNKYDFICHDMNIVLEEKLLKRRLKLKKSFSNRNLIENLLIEGNPIANSSVIVKKSLLENIGYISEDHPTYTIDYHTWLRVSQITNKFYYFNKYLGIYRIHNENLSSQVLASSSYFKVLKAFKLNISRGAYKKSLGYYCYLKFFEKGVIKRKDVLLKFFKKSIQLSTIKIKFKIIARIILSIY
tara:strand:+ start:3530 stop:4405 length:876 start_codon:yes stop_codon:yes gene_type:complete